MPTETGYTAFLRDLPRDWQTAQVSAVARVVGGGTPSRDVPAFWGGDIPWVTPGEISGERFAYLSETRENISALGLSGSGATLLPASSLMVTTRATLGARAINVVPMTTNQGFKSLVFERESDALFFYYLTDKLKPELKRRASGTTFLEVSGAEFAKIEVPQPPVSERQLIAEILDTLDTTIRQTEAIIEKLKQVKQGLLHDLLNRGIDANGELRPPQRQAPHLYKDSPLGWIPREWVLRRLDSVAAVLDPNPSHRNPIYVEQGFPFISTVEFLEGDEVETSTPRRVAEETVIDQERICSFVAGSIGFSRKGTIGQMRFLPTHTRFALLDSLCVVNARAGMSTTFLMHTLRGTVVQKQIKLSTMGVALPQLSIGRVRDLILPTPQTEEQERIAGPLDSLTDRMACERANLSKARNQKSGLMEDLLTGRVRVTPLLA